MASNGKGWERLSVLMQDAEALALVKEPTQEQTQGIDDWVTLPVSDDAKASYIASAEKRLQELAEQAKTLMASSSKVAQEQGRKLGASIVAAFKVLQRAAKSAGKDLSDAATTAIDEVRQSLWAAGVGVVLLLAFGIWMLTKK